jgi:zinc D-Ala-D-Ala carboxypeptidase
MTYFSDKELACKCGKCDSSNKMDPTFMYKLNILRANFGKPIYLSSAYRCPDYNEKVSSTGRNGPHTTGKAADLLVSGKDAHTILMLAANLHFSGIGISQKGEHGKRFIHLDNIGNGPVRPWVWSY